MSVSLSGAWRSAPRARALDRESHHEAARALATPRRTRRFAFGHATIAAAGDKYSYLRICGLVVMPGDQPSPADLTQMLSLILTSDNKKLILLLLSALALGHMARLS